MTILEYTYADGRRLAVHLGNPPYAILTIAPPGIPDLDSKHRSQITVCDTLFEALYHAAYEITRAEGSAA